MHSSSIFFFLALLCFINAASTSNIPLMDSEGESKVYGIFDTATARQPQTTFTVTNSMDCQAKLVKMLVEPGQAIAFDDELYIVEVMKMQIIVRSVKEGTVSAISVEEGDILEGGAVILELLTMDANI